MCNENCENKNLTVEDLKFFLDGYIDETTDDVVVVPREEYDELVAEAAILRVVEKILESDDYSGDIVKTLRSIVEIGKPEHEHTTVPDEKPSTPGPDEEASE